MSAASTFVMGVSMTVVSFIRCGFGATFGARHLLDHLHFAEPLFDRLRRCAAPASAGRYIAVDNAGPRNLRAFADRHVVIYADPRTQHNKVFQGRAAGYSHLRHQYAVTADADVMADLDQVVDLAALANDRVANGAAVDGGTGADFDIVLNNDAADLRDLQMAAAAHHEAEAVLPDLAARMDDDAIADQRVADDGSRADRAVAPDPHLSSDHCGGADDGAAADLGARPDHRARLDRDAALQPRGRVHMGAGGLASLGQRGWPQRMGK